MDYSEISTEDANELSEEEKNVRIFAIQMLKSRIFLGQFQEKRYVSDIQQYRDVIVLSNSENDLKNDLILVKRRLRTFYKMNYWIGITEPNCIGAPNGYSIWVESENRAFGKYWYKIRGVRFRKNEIILKIKFLRNMTDYDDNFTALDTPLPDIVSQFLENLSCRAVIENFQNSAVEFMTWFFTVMTFQNIKDAIKFISVLFVTSLAFSVKGIEYLMNFSLKFMREFSYFVQSSTPVMIACINLIGRIFGGFYLLIAMIWRDSTKPKKPPPAQLYYRQIEMPSYRSQSGVVITEIE